MASMGLYTGSKSDFGHDYNCTFTPGSGPLPTTTTTRPAPQPGPAPVPACLRDQASIPKPTSASAEGVPITEFTSYTDSSGKQWAYFQADMSQSAHDPAAWPDAVHYVLRSEQHPGLDASDGVGVGHQQRSG